MILLAVLLIVLDGLLLAWLSQGAQLPPPMEVEVAGPKWISEVSWQWRLPQEHDVWPWWRPGT